MRFMRIYAKKKKVIEITLAFSSFYTFALLSFTYIEFENPLQIACLTVSNDDKIHKKNRICIYLLIEIDK